MNTSSVLLIFALSFAHAAIAQVSKDSSTRCTPETLRAKVIRVTDGDTFRINILCHDSPIVLARNLRIRVLGIDCPEIKKSKCGWGKILGNRAKDLVEEKILGKEIRLKNCEGATDRYSRVLCDVFVGGESLAEILLAENLAYPYYGKTRNPGFFCKEDRSCCKKKDGSYESCCKKKKKR
ncbi:MAG: thermonuclease family protein [Cytophagales bacterium]|nr:thermonuclease family protein [Cytophagales bacterium]